MLTTIAKMINKAVFNLPTKNHLYSINQNPVMNVLLKKAIALIFTFVVVVSCSKDDNVVAPSVDDERIFIWNAMNYWYLYKDDSPNLVDTKDDNPSDFLNYLNSFSNPRKLFDNLKAPIDRFSFITDNYITLEQEFQGVSTSTGFDYTPVGIKNSDDVLIIVNYVLPNSPAHNAGITRGEIAWGIDGVQLNTLNFFNLINQSSFTINFTDISMEDDVLSWQSNGRDVPITRIPLTENPIFLETVIDINGIRVGYLVYNQFIETFHSELNDTFGRLKSANIDELVLDLRYNPGGRVDTSVFLTSMINGKTAEGNPLVRLLHRSDRLEFNRVFSYTNDIRIFDKNSNFVGEVSLNRLDNLNRVFILTGSQTASASEVVINELRESMNVILLGGRTRGKNEASLTLYDNENINDQYLLKERANPNHLWAIQPIIAQVSNSKGFSDYAGGFPLTGRPTFEEEYYALANNGLEPLGDLNEPLLKMALDKIITGMPIMPSRLRRSLIGNTLIKPIQVKKGKMLLDGLIKQ